MAHEFYVAEDRWHVGLYYFDHENGWEGDEIAFCPWCGEQLLNEGLNEGPKTRSGILEAAKKCVCQDRNNQYGDPENNFELIARLWRAYLNATGLGFGKDEEQTMITAEDVAVMMCLLKIARIATGEQKADSWIDAIGYMACGGEIALNDDPRKGCRL